MLVINASRNSVIRPTHLAISEVTCPTTYGVASPRVNTSSAAHTGTRAIRVATQSEIRSRTISRTVATSSPAPRVAASMTDAAPPRPPTALATCLLCVP